jgi:hypothetical protein
VKQLKAAQHKAEQQHQEAVAALEEELGMVGGDCRCRCCCCRCCSCCHTAHPAAPPADLPAAPAAARLQVQQELQQQLSAKADEVARLTASVAQLAEQLEGKQRQLEALSQQLLQQQEQEQQEAGATDAAAGGATPSSAASHPPPVLCPGAQPAGVAGCWATWWRQGTDTADSGGAPP